MSGVVLIYLYVPQCTTYALFRILIISKVFWNSVSDNFIHFHLSYPLLSSFIHFYPFSSTFIHPHPPSSTFIYFHPLSSILSTFIHFHPLHPISSIFIHFFPFSSILTTVIHCYPFVSFVIHFIHSHPFFIHFNLFYSLSSTFIHFYPLSSTFIHFHPLLSTLLWSGLVCFGLGCFTLICVGQFGLQITIERLQCSKIISGMDWVGFGRKYLYALILRALLCGDNNTEEKNERNWAKIYYNVESIVRCWCGIFWSHSWAVQVIQILWKLLLIISEEL